MLYKTIIIIAKNNLFCTLILIELSKLMQKYYHTSFLREVYTFLHLFHANLPLVLFFKKDNNFFKILLWQSVFALNEISMNENIEISIFDDQLNKLIEITHRLLISEH